MAAVEACLLDALGITAVNMIRGQNVAPEGVTTVRSLADVKAILPA